jgi:three-Cys-motif partner protein
MFQCASGALGERKMTRVQKFGGTHTERKLEAVASYLQAYVKLSYIDAFAGSGASQPIADVTSAKTGLLEDEIYDADTIIEGSPVRALTVEPAFDRYIFVDANSENVRSLQDLVAEYPARNSKVLRGDANAHLASFTEFLERERFERAVVFLDPFGLSVRWETVARLASTGKVDLWYLVPVLGMSRQIRSDGTFLPSAKKIDDIWGSGEWRTKAVREAEPIEDLFGQIDQRFEKVARAEQFSEMFRERLSEVYKGGVAKRYLPLGRGRLHEFSLMFACANPSPPAASAALRIANHILGRA